ncbi:MAG: RlmE family RNA methyltransferase [Wolbachia endosymbiont of Xenopsylla cheopis]
MSSTKWLSRHVNDRYVKNAHTSGYRSRSAFKLIEIDDKFGLFKACHKVIDLGAYPGGWSQVAAQRVIKNNQGLVFAVDLQKIEDIQNVKFVQCDIIDDAHILHDKLGSYKFDLILSDMAPKSCGCSRTDHIRIINLCERALELAKQFLGKDGKFVVKIFPGECEKSFLNELKQAFKVVKYFKPKSSRADSAEIYLLGLGFCL